MAQYKVKALHCASDFLQKVFNAGDVVDDTMFHQGDAQKKCDDGFLELIPEEKKETKKEEPKKK